MNKKTALFLLTAGGIAGVSLFAVVNMFIIPLFLIEIFFIFFGADRLRILFRERYGIGTARFILLGELPSLLISAAACIIILAMKDNGVWEGQFLGGVTEIYGAVLAGITSLLLIAGTLCGVFAERLAEKKAAKSAASEDI